jgi:hypothetical protein
MINKQDYVDLGLSCADVCTALDRGLDGRRLHELSKPVLGAIGQLTMRVELPTRTMRGPLTKVSITEPWLGSRTRSSNGVNGMWPLDSSTRRTTRTRSLLGGWTSTESFTSSAYV